MATNQILPFGMAGGANVLNYATYSALAARLSGFSAGTAHSEQLNTVWRQSSFVASMIGQYIVDQTGYDVLDDGDVSAFLKKFIRAVRAQRPNFQPIGGSVNALTLTLDPAPATLVELDGTPLRFTTSGTNTSTPTLNVNGTGAKNIVYPDGANLSTGEFQANKLIEVVYVAATDKFVMTSRSDSAGSRESPLYGLYAPPAASFNVPDNVITKVTSFGTIVNNLPGTTLVAGDMTIGVTGYYLISFYLGTNYATQAGSYSYSVAINVNGVSKIGNSGASINSAGLGLGAFFSGMGILPLTAGNVLTLTQKQNSGVTQPGQMALSVVLIGK